MVQSALWVAFQAALTCASTLRRRWRRVIGWTTMGIAIVRVALWIAKAVASAGTVDTALNLIGLGEYVRPFEDAVDTVFATVVSVIVTVTPTG